MVKTKMMTVLMLAGLLTVLVSCKGNATSSGEKSDVWAITSDGITLNGTLLKYTGEVYVMRDTVTITGEDPSFIYSSADDIYKGVFRKGRTVTLSPFIMSKYEVTQSFYKAVMTGNSDGVNSEPFYCTVDNEDFNVLLEGEEQKYRAAEGMTWYDAVYFCNVLSEKTGLTKAYTITNITVNGDGNITSATVELVANAKGYRLPTEAEWEFAARGGDTAKPDWNYLFSGAPKATGSIWNDLQNTGLDAVGWYSYNKASGTTSAQGLTSGTAGYGTHQVGKKTANALGIFDMSGNVSEWCYDRYELISTGNVTNPSGPTSSDSLWVQRGGSWLSYAGACSVSTRNYGYDLCLVGFRVVRNAQ